MALVRHDWDKIKAMSVNALGTSKDKKTRRSD
jgi:hypothetical protein